MQSFALQSSHMNGGEYDEPSGSLLIHFTNGAVYQYLGVPQTVVDSLRQGAGGYFHAHISGRYNETQIASGTTKSGRRSRRRF